MNIFILNLCIHVHISLNRLYKIAHICFLPILIIMI
jgi:hypothetical protein